MSFSLTKIVLLITLCGLSYQFFANDTKVVQLTDKNFDQEVVQSKDVWMVLFYAPWCGHCKRFHPEYEKAAKGLEGIFKIGAVNSVNEKNLAKKYKISGYPTVYFFGADKANPEEYNGKRTAEAVADYLFEKAKSVFTARLGEKKEEPKKAEKKPEEAKKAEKKVEKVEKKDESDDGKDVVVLTDDNFEEKVFGSEDMWLVAFYAPWCGHCKRLLPEWNKAATQLKGKGVVIAKLDATAHKKMAKKYEIHGYPTIKVFATGKGKDKAVEDYKGTRKVDGIVSYSLDKLKEFKEKQGKASADL